jgi:hypothetical protein
VSAPVAAGPGAWEATLAISRARGARETLVVARAAGLEGQIAIEVIPEVVPDAPRERRVFVAPKGGVVAGRGGVWAPALGAEGGFRTGLLDGRLALSLEAGAFVRDRTDEVTVGAQRLDVRGRVLYVPVIASIRIEQAVGARQLAWASVGGGVALVTSEVSARSLSTTRSEAGAVGAGKAAVGWGLRFGRATPFAEVGVAWQGDPGFDALRGSLTVLGVSLGCRYDAF